MTRENLARASDLLESIDAGGETADRIADLAAKLDRQATGDRGPDHGQLARVQTILDDLQTELDDEGAATIEDVRQAVVDYRETVDGV